MKTSLNVEITSEAEYKMLIERIYIEIQARIDIWKDKYSTAFKGNKIIQRKDRQAFYEQLKEMQTSVEKASDQLKDKGIDVRKHTEKLKKHIVDLTSETPDELQEMKNRAEIYFELREELYPQIGQWEDEVIRKLKCKIFVERRLGDLYEWNENDITRSPNLKGASYATTCRYISITYLDLCSYKYYLENLRDKLSHDHNLKDLNSNDEKAEIEEEIILTTKAIELFKNLQRKITKNSITVEKWVDKVRKLLPDIIENWKNGKIGENFQEWNWENEKTEESPQELDWISSSRFPLSPVGKPQLKDKSIKKPWYRKVADWIEDYIPFLGKFFNKVLDKIFGEIDKNQSVVQEKSQKQKTNQIVKDVNSINLQNNPPVKEKVSNINTKQHH